jgi:hypothetical protein
MQHTTRRNLLRGALLASGAGTVAARAQAQEIVSSSLVSLADLGGVPNITKFDNTPALDAAIQQRVQTLYIPRGQWYFLTKPRVIDYPIRMVGEGFATSYLVRSYTPTSASDALLTLTKGASRIEKLGLGAGGATAGGAGIALISNGTSSPDFSVIEDVYISVDPAAPGNWSYAILVDGVARTTAPIGVRDLDIRNCCLFASTHAACRINGAVAVSFRGGGMYPAAGVTGKLQITGTGAVSSYYITVDTGYLGGLDVQSCRYANIRAAVIAGDITNASDAEDVMVLGQCTGVVQAAWLRSSYVAPSN